jgi:hypothetical protein
MPGKSEQHFQVILRPTLPIGVNAKVELKSSISIGSITENVFKKITTLWP